MVLLAKGSDAPALFLFMSVQRRHVFVTNTKTPTTQIVRYAWKP